MMMGLFGGDRTDTDANRFVRDEHKLTNYNYKVRATLSKLVDEVKRLNDDLTQAHDALRNIVERERFDLPAGRMNVVGRMRALKGVYKRIVDSGREGPLAALADSAKGIPPLLDTAIGKMEKEEYKTRQQVADDLLGIFEHAKAVSTHLTLEQRRLQENLERETQQLRRVG